MSGTPDLARTGFASAADAYERGRPSYASGAIEELVRALSLGPASRVVDLAAGTGLLTRLIAPHVGHVVAVEPSADMRRVLADRVAGVEVLDGEAERIPLDDGGVDAVVVGEAFHWFATEAAVAEIARVLCPGGALALLWNVWLRMEPPFPPDLDADIDRRRQAALPAKHRYLSGAWRAPLDAHASPFGPLQRAASEHAHRSDPDMLAAQVASWSFVATLPPADREPLVARVRAAAPRTTVTRYRTDLHWAVER